MEGSIILAGGGDKSESKPIDELLVRLTAGDRGMLYLPIAMDGSGRSYQSCLNWLRSVFIPLGFDRITMWTDLTDKDGADLAPFSSVYLGGGNTFRLLRELRKHRFGGALRQFVARGGVVYGGSAGAIVLGRDIMTSAHLDRDHEGVVDTSGLDLARGHNIWCHYRPEDDPLIFAHVQRVEVPVLALSERAGVHITREALQSIGFEPAVLFDKHTRRDLTTSFDRHLC